jgi:CheY-like chemotaxis protein
MKENKSKILVIDDNRDFLEYINDALSDDFEIVSAETGKLGLEQAASMRPDLILLDINMPGMDGIEFIKQIAVKSNTGFIPIIVISASKYNVITERMIRDEPNVKAFMSKLIPIDNLKELMFKIIEGK